MIARAAAVLGLLAAATAVPHSRRQLQTLVHDGLRAVLRFWRIACGATFLTVLLVAI